MRKLLSLTALVAAIALASSAGASIAPPVELSLSRGGTQIWSNSPSLTDNLDGTFSGAGSWLSDPGGARLDFFDVMVNPDPSVFLNFGFTNNTGVTDTWTMTATMSILPSELITAGSTIGGSVGGSVDDSDFFNGATASNLLYEAFVDRPGTGPGDPPWDAASPVLTLLNGTTVIAPVFGNAPIGPESQGLPGPTLPGPTQALVDISIDITFTLTAGDTVSFSSAFQIEPLVPAPGAMALLAISGLLGGGRRRRR